MSLLKGKMKPFFGSKEELWKERLTRAQQAAVDPLQFAPMFVDPTEAPKIIPAVRVDMHLFTNSNVFMSQHAIASHFGVYLAERFDHKRPADWARLSLEYIHPIFRQVASALVTTNMSAGIAAQILVMLLNTKFLKREQCIGMMSNVWDILINDPSQSPLFPTSDVDLFMRLYMGPSLVSFNHEFVWRLAQKLDRFLISELSLPRSFLKDMRLQIETWFQCLVNK